MSQPRIRFFERDRGRFGERGRRECEKSKEWNRQATHVAIPSLLAATKSGHRGFVENSVRCQQTSLLRIAGGAVADVVALQLRHAPPGLRNEQVTGANVPIA